MANLHPEITAELLKEAFVGGNRLGGKHPTARGKILRLLDGDFEKLNELAIEHGLAHAGDYSKPGRVVANPKALETPAKIQELAADAPKGSNPWVSDIVDAQGKPDWSIAARRRQQEVTKSSIELASRLAESAGSFVGAPRPGAKSLLPRAQESGVRRSY